MKKTLSLLMVVVMLGITLVSCGGKMTEKDIIGEWKLDSVKISDEAAEKTGMSAKDAEDAIEGIYSLATYDFREDGEYAIVAFGQDGEVGEWKLEGKKVVLDDGSVAFEIDGKKLVLEEDGAKIVFKKK